LPKRPTPAATPTKDAPPFLILTDYIAEDPSHYTWELQYSANGTGLFYAAADNPCRLNELNRYILSVLHSRYPHRQLVLTLHRDERFLLTPLWQLTATAHAVHPYLEQHAN
jgi:hypothetical protein